MHVVEICMLLQQNTSYHYAASVLEMMRHTNMQAHTLYFCFNELPVILCDRIRVHILKRGIGALTRLLLFLDCVWKPQTDVLLQTQKCELKIQVNDTDRQHAVCV